MQFTTHVRMLAEQSSAIDVVNRTTATIEILEGFSVEVSSRFTALWPGLEAWKT